MKGWLPILAFWGTLYYLDWWQWAYANNQGLLMGFVGFIGVFYTFVWIGRAS